MRCSLVLTAAVFIGCAPLAGTREGHEHIVGGMETSDEPAVVLVISEVPNSKFATLCTGSVVSPHVVLTAAHCVDPSNVGTGAQFGLYFGTDVETAMTSDLQQVTSTAFDPKYDSSDFEAGSDIGVVVATDTLPQTPLPMNRASVGKSLVGQDATLYGYGEVGPDMASTAGVKREVGATLVSYNSDFVYFGMAGATACEGDSGGPAVMTIDGTDTIVGVVSYGDASCDKAVAYSRTDTYDVWIDQQIDAADPGYLPANVTETKHSGCAIGACNVRASWSPVVALLLLAFAVRRRVTCC